MKRHSFFYLFISSLVLSGFASCESDADKAAAANNAKESVTVVCDPSWQPFLSSVITTYEALNPRRSVHLIVKPETECIEDLLSNRYQTVFVSRDFTKAEYQKIRNKQSVIQNDTLCFDGLTWVVPKTFPADSVDLLELKDLFVSGRFRQQPYTIQLNATGSSVANYLSSYFGVPPSTTHLYASGSDEEILKNIASKQYSIACISSFWLVNLENRSHRDWLDSVKLLKIVQPSDAKAYTPFQNDLALDLYPFKRVLRVLNKEPDKGLGTAFAYFLISERGQRIILKDGLLPMHIPTRNVELKID